MKLYIALSTLIALSQACVTLTIKDDFKANTYSWAIWKDGKREASRAFGGQRPPSVDADDGTNFWSVNVYPYDDFSKMSGTVTKYTSGKLAWNQLSRFWKCSTNVRTWRGELRWKAMQSSSINELFLKGAVEVIRCICTEFNPYHSGQMLPLYWPCHGLSHLGTPRITGQNVSLNVQPYDDLTKASGRCGDRICSVIRWASTYAPSAEAG
ncbi:hypothetical protein DER45DRAFT_534251 [Fusarium avenaceum]|nr:hypothetical protein DER45DRAFT_534251 [Fusarium avenaceum]